MSELALVVRSAVAPLNAEPRAGSEQVTQALAGHLLTVVEERAPWFRVRASDGYTGWLHRGYADPCNEADRARRFALGRVSLGCTVREPGAQRRPLPLGALLADDTVVEAGEALTAAALPARFPRTADSIIDSARHFYAGTSYQWGGVSPWGADCSGMVQRIFTLHGIALARDARDQGEQGADAGRDISALAPGDLLYFSDRDDGRVTHVGIATGRSGMLHVALGRGGYAEERLGATDDAYVSALRDRFRFARRPAL